MASVGLSRVGAAVALCDAHSICHLAPLRRGPRARISLRDCDRALRPPRPGRPAGRPSTHCYGLAPLALLHSTGIVLASRMVSLFQSRPIATDQIRLREGQ